MSHRKYLKNPCCLFLVATLLFISTNADAQNNTNSGCYSDLDLSTEALKAVAEKVLPDINDSVYALKKLEDWKDKLDKITEMAESWRQTEQAYHEWKNGGYEDFKAGSQFAIKMGESMRSMKRYIPFPKFLSAYFECLFDIIPVLIGKFTAILDNHLQQIDDEYRRATGAVEYNGLMKCASVAGGTCLVTDKMVKIIKSLNIPEYKKQDLFRLACFGGWSHALEHLND